MWVLLCVCPSDSTFVKHKHSAEYWAIPLGWDADIIEKLHVFWDRMLRKKRYDI
jgi:hypothetical protein